MEAAHATDLTGLATVAVAALLCGLLLRRFGQPAIVGYIIAGILLGPAGLGLIPDASAVGSLAELGVLLLLFVVGMELSVRTFRKLWRVYVTVTLLQAAASAGVLVLLARVFDWPFALALLMAFMVALSSTAVAIRMLEDLGLGRSRVGRLTVGVLIAQDLAVVPMILVIQASGSAGWGWDGVIKIVFAVTLLAALVYVLGRGRRINLPFARAGQQRELAPLLALGFCFGAAALSGLVGLSAAYGAFLAGMVIGNSRQRHALMEVTRPLESVLVMVFFVSVGLLVDLDYVIDNIGLVLLLFFLVALFKTALNAILLRVLGQPWRQAFLAAVVLAQVGEFSFLLAGTGISAGIIGVEGQRLIVAVTVLSLGLSPLWVLTARRLQGMAAEGITSARELLRLVYAPEAELVSDTFDAAGDVSHRAYGRVQGTLRRLRARRLKSPAAGPGTAPFPPDIGKPSEASAASTAVTNPTDPGASVTPEGLARPPVGQSVPPATQRPATPASDPASAAEDVAPSEDSPDNPPDAPSRT